MMAEDELIGSFTVYRQEVRPFADKQIELVKNFAAQAVIAIENARLLNELRQSLDRQTATSEVLGVISSSPDHLEPVFTSMLRNAVRICDATFGNIHRWDGKALHLAAAHNTPPSFAEARRRSPNRPHPKSSVGRMIEVKEVVHVADAKEQPGYAIERDPGSVAAVELGGVRTVLYVPMLKDNEVVGAFTLSRQEVRPFTDKQIALVTNFAAQAVIAIENARLLNELRERTDDLSQRTDDLTEALEQQTATSEVLRVI
jgi:GAF domain-containing protein